MPPLEAMRRVDRQVADLRLALLPLPPGRGRLFRRTGAERSVPALLACVHWARVLAAAAEVRRRRCRGGEALLAQATRIERTLTELTAFVTETASAPLEARPFDAPKAAARRRGRSRQRWTIWTARSAC